MPIFLAPLALAAQALGQDPRLAATASLLQPRLTYAEFGAWAQKATGVRILVSPAIRDRKATVLVENRPVGETMNRVAETLFLEWERTKSGYTLRLRPEVAALEVRQIDEETRVAENELRVGLDAVVRLAREDDASLQKEIDATEAELKRLDADETRAGKARAAGVRFTQAMAEKVRGDNGIRPIAAVLGGLTSAERDALLAGKWFYASHPQLPGTRPIPPIESEDDDPGRTVISMHVVPGSHTLTTQTMWLDRSVGIGSRIAGSDSASFDRAASDSPLTQRLEGWATLADEGLLRTPLAPLKVPPATHPSGGRTLADALVSLHARTGIPIVADGFREASARDGLTLPKDVKAWIEALDAAPDAAGVYERAAGGWLMLRRAYYWRLLADEVPEAPVRALEASPGGLDDFAAFVAALSPAQAAHLGATELVMDARSEPLWNVTFLRLWNSLDRPSRLAAAAEGGVRLGALSAAARELFAACLEQSLNNAWLPENLAYVLPGGPPLPEDLRLSVTLNAQVPVYDTFEPASGAEGLVPKATLYQGVQARLGVPGRPLAAYDFPLRHKEP